MTLPADGGRRWQTLAVRVVVCDDDALMREMVEAVATRAGHQVVGVADTTSAALALIEAAHPEVVILDFALGFNTDFDIIESASAVGARPVVFSKPADAGLLGRYEVHPTFVPKPDLVALERILARLDVDADQHAVVEHERRQRPGRAAAGPVPTGPSDAQAYFEAVNDARPGDGLVSIEVGTDAGAVAEAVGRLLRGSDRLLLFPRVVRVFLPAGGEAAVTSFLQRVVDSDAVPGGGQAASVVVAEGEHGTDAFDRLKHAPTRPL